MPERLYRQCQRPAPRCGSRRWDYDYRNNLVWEERDDNPFSWYRWQYDSAGRLLVQDDTLPGQEQMRWEGANSAWEKLLQGSGTQLSGYSQNLRMQGQYLDREIGLTTICFGIMTRTAVGLRSRTR